MQEKIKIVMEETGCDEGQAQIALESCNYNISKSITKIFDLLKDIVVVKGKFYTYGVHLYGMIMIIVDINHRRHLRTRALVTYNPKVYETDLQQNWYEYDKKLYTARLLPGSMQDVTLSIEKKIVEEILDEYSESFFTAVKKNNIMEVADILEDILREPLKTSAVNFEILNEELNLTQFKKISDRIFPPQMEFEFKEYDFGLVDLLKIDVMPVAYDGDFILQAGRLMPGDEIAVLINDTREISQYLSGLIGGRNIFGAIAIPCKIHEITHSKNGVAIMVRLAAGVVGQVTVSENTPIKVVKWVSRSGFFNRMFFRFYLIFFKLFEKIKKKSRIKAHE
ncbi:MAG: hypothetical protein COS68_04500 [Elusimicrobia bacterium CG06_land_8_20_14_3_00_38_11]|nr:MAG: hypothetical protein COS68_04500 [Elusimicrobia bacterium CG06_land_8_20_14_3_00_38_11]